jgi:hypothetical protein
VIRGTAAFAASNICLTFVAMTFFLSRAVCGPCNVHFCRRNSEAPQGGPGSACSASLTSCASWILGQLDRTPTPSTRHQPHASDDAPRDSNHKETERHSGRASSLICPCISSFSSRFRLQRWTELEHVRRGRRGSGGSRHAWGDARPDRALACVDCYAGFIRPRCCYQSHTMRALWAVACLTNELQVRSLIAGEQSGSGRAPPAPLLLLRNR